LTRSWIFGIQEIGTLKLKDNPVRMFSINAVVSNEIGFIRYKGKGKFEYLWDDT